MPLEATVDLLIGQWVESPRLQAAIEAPLAIARDEILPALERVRLMHGIDHAEGVWLDYLGLRVGLRRPATTDPSQDLRFGFEGTPQARGFDQVPFAGDEANAAIYPLHDRIFRNFVRARAHLVLGDGTLQTFTEAVRFIDEHATVVDGRDMTVTVATIRRELLELADSIHALPRTAGVRVTYLDL